MTHWQCWLLILYLPIALLTTAALARMFGRNAKAEAMGIIWPITWVLLILLGAGIVFEWAAKRGCGCSK